MFTRFYDISINIPLFPPFFALAIPLGKGDFKHLIFKSNSGVCLEVKAKLPYMATVLLHAVAKMVVGLPKAMSAIAFKPPSGAR